MSSQFIDCSVKESEEILSEGLGLARVYDEQMIQRFVRGAYRAWCAYLIMIQVPNMTSYS